MLWFSRGKNCNRVWLGPFKTPCVHLGPKSRSEFKGVSKFRKKYRYLASRLGFAAKWRTYIINTAVVKLFFSEHELRAFLVMHKSTCKIIATQIQSFRFRENSNCGTDRQKHSRNWISHMSHTFQVRIVGSPGFTFGE